MADTEMPYTYQPPAGDSRGSTYIKAGIVLAVGVFLALFVVTESARTAATVMLLFGLAGSALLVGWVLGHKSATRAMEIQSQTLAQAMAFTPMQIQSPLVPQLPARAVSVNSNPPIAPGFERPGNKARIMLIDGTLPEVELDLIRAFIDECYPDCNRERWRHTNAEYGEMARIMCNMRGAPLVEHQANRYKWQQGITREQLEDWYTRVLAGGRD